MSAKHTPGPWTIRPLSGKYYGTEIDVGENLIVVWTPNHYRSPFASEREIANGWEPEDGHDHVEDVESYANAAHITACDPDTISALLEERDALATALEAAREEIGRLRADRDSWEQQASDREADWYAEHLRAERLREALRGWWKMRRPVGWTEDQHRSCPHVNLATDAEKALATALLREQETTNG